MGKKLKVCIIGCGGIGGYHLENLRLFEGEGLIDLVGFCDLIEEKAVSFATMTGHGKTYTNFETMVDELKPDCCFICIPPYCHGNVEKGLIKRGIHFFVEKPVGLDMKLAMEIEKLVKENNIITAVGFQCRASSICDVQREFMKKHPIVYCNLNRMGGIPGTEWWGLKELSGGQVVEQTIHNIDLMRYFLGEPKTVFSFGTKGFVKEGPFMDKYNTDDLTTTVVKFESGVLGSISTGCYTKNGEAYNSNFTFSALDARCEHKILSKLTIYGEKPAEKNTPDNFVIKNDGGISSSTEDGIVIRHVEGTGGELNDRTFINAVITGDSTKIFAPYSEGVKTLGFVLAINKSIDTGEPVEVADMFK